MTTNELIDELKRTPRGFEYIEFNDGNGHQCTVQQSSAVGDCEGAMENPGSSFLWLGLEDAKPQILASQAADLGVETNETCGWIPYPVPAQVMFNTRMHLHRDHVVDLVEVLQRWLATGSLEATE